MNAVDPVWRDVDQYLSETLSTEDEALAAAREAGAAAGLPNIAVVANHAKFLELLCRVRGARRALEFGTLAGYSTISLARGVGAGGHVTTLELEQHHAEVARTNFERAGVADRVEIRVGPALDSAHQLIEEQVEPFDFVFIDADKRNNPGYLETSLQLTRSGSVIFVDNVVREGAVVDAHSEDPDVRGIRRMLEMMAADPRLDSSAVQTVDPKEYDGFAIALVL